MIVGVRCCIANAQIRIYIFLASIYPIAPTARASACLLKDARRKTYGYSNAKKGIYRHQNKRTYMDHAIEAAYFVNAFPASQAPPTTSPTAR